MDRLAVNTKTALRMFWDAGYTTETALAHAYEMLCTLHQPTRGYYMADDVSALIEKKGV